MGALLIACALGGCEKSHEAAKPVVRINAAASIALVIEGMSDDIERELGLRIAVNAGGSGVLAQQITRGDRVDLFISADAAWMDNLELQGLIDSSTRADLAGNGLVLIGLKGMDAPPDAIEDLSDKQYQPIAVGDPAYVPAGGYAVQVFEAHGLNQSSGLHLAEAPNVRAAVSFVLAGQCPVGLSYASDVRVSEDIEVLFSIDPADHDPIRYPAVVLKDAPNREQALRVLAWLQGEQALSAFRSAGFMDPESNGGWRETR